MGIAKLSEDELKILWYDLFESLAVINAGMIRANEEKASIERKLQAVNQRLADKQKPKKKGK